MFWQIVIITLSLILQSDSANNSSATKNKCEGYLKVLGKTLYDITRCVIRNAKPVTLCQECVVLFKTLMKDNSTLNQMRNEKNSKCSESFTDLDTLHLVPNLINFQDKLFLDAKCKNCYPLGNTSKMKRKRRALKRFRKMQAKVISCFKNSNKIGLSQMCLKCKKDYLTMNKYFKRSKKHGQIGSMACMDVQDIMNTTQKVWNKQCSRKIVHNESIMLASCFFMIVFTVIFYIYNKERTQKKSTIAETTFE